MTEDATATPTATLFGFPSTIYTAGGCESTSDGKTDLVREADGVGCDDRERVLDKEGEADGVGLVPSDGEFDGVTDGDVDIVGVMEMDAETLGVPDADTPELGTQLGYNGLQNLHALGPGPQQDTHDASQTAHVSDVPTTR